MSLLDEVVLLPENEPEFSRKAWSNSEADSAVVLFIELDAWVVRLFAVRLEGACITVSPLCSSSSDDE